MGTEAMSKIKLIASIVFGIFLPVLILFQAYSGMASLKDDVVYNVTTSDLAMNLGEAKENLDNPNDYALFSLLYVEHANQKTMINKQILKTSVMHIGFAVISIGMMLIILGIEQGGVEGAFSSQGVSFDFKTGSTGVAVFCVGALMATIGGVLKNEYTTSTIPSFGEVSMPASFSRDQSVSYRQSLDAFKKCSSFEENSEVCFMQAFLQINRDALK